MRLTRINVFSDAFLKRNAWKRSLETAEDVTSNWEELVLMIAARMADQMIPVINGAERDFAMMMNTLQHPHFPEGC